MVLLLSVSLLASAAGCSEKKPASGGKLLVVTSIFPAADIIRNVGGGMVEVKMLVQPGQSPHTFEPLPRDMAAVSRADVFATIGFGLEFWADKLAANSQNPKMTRIVFADRVAPIKSSEENVDEEKHKDGDHGHGQYNPHFWLSPKIAIGMAEQVRDALSAARPGSAAAFAANCDAYTAELKRLDADYRKTISGFSTKKFVAFHSAWDYLARDYGLEQAAVIEEFPGKEPTPKKLARIVDLVRALHVKAIFAEPQLNPKIAEVIAAESGVKTAIIDPIGGPDVPGRGSYIKLMRYNLAELEKVMK